MCDLRSSSASYISCLCLRCGGTGSEATVDSPKLLDVAESGSKARQCLGVEVSDKATSEVSSKAPDKVPTKAPTQPVPCPVRSVAG
mmetsp:Transcript_47206/g.98830  ORF Transcript_47206/g.98830 Transcript_47206/m.98830 type:complete len:86 (+) Transcript_47206:347-604(+)